MGQQSRVPVLCSRLAYSKTSGLQQVGRDPVPSWAEARSPSVAVCQPVICGNFRSPWIPGPHTLPAGLSGWAVGTAEMLVQEPVFTHHQTTPESWSTQYMEKTMTERADVVLLW